MKYLVRFTIFIAALLPASVSHALPILSIDVDPAAGGIQASRTVTVGSTFMVNVRIDDVTGLYAYDIDVDHNSAVLTATNALEGPFLAAGGATFFHAPTPADPVNAVATLLGAVPGVSGSGVLYSIQYSALAVGSSLLDFTSLDLLDDQFNPIQPELAAGSINVVAQIPEPSTLLMLGVGFAGLAAARRPRR
jgi:hypothetical protein